MTTPAKNSYGQILKSSALIGASSAVEIALRIVRIKAMALLLGPTGVGLLGLYYSITDLAQAVGGMGINNSGIREIAHASAAGEADGVARTVLVMRRMSVLLGLLTAAALVVFSQPIAAATFDDPDYAPFVVLLSLAVLFRMSAGGQQSVLQGMRRISDLARIAAWEAVLGTCFTIAIVYFLREDGLVPALVAAAAMNLLLSLWYGRRIEIARTSVTARQARRAVSDLLKLGFAFMASGLLVMGSAYAIRVIVLRSAGVEAAGLYQSAWTIGGLYLGFILQAMGTDFYPRLTAAAHDDSESNRLINEQTQIGLLLAGPGVLATLALTPLVIAVLYSAQFEAAVEPLRWICLGMMLRVITWPLGFIVLARGMRTLLVAIDLAYALVHIALAWVLVARFDVVGAGAAFCGSYVFHALVVYPLARNVTGFRYSPANRRLLLLFVSLIGTVFAGFALLPSAWGTALGVLATVGSSVYALRTLIELVPPDRSPPIVRRILGALRLAPAEQGR